MARPSPLLLKLRRLWTHDIWIAGLTRERTLKNRFLTLLRIVSITLSGLQELKVAARAAALSYSSLLGLGPLIAIAVLISGFALGERDSTLVANGLNNVIGFVAPQIDQYQQAISAQQSQATPAPADSPAAGKTPATTHRAPIR